MTVQQKSFQAKTRQLQPQWYVIDANEAVVGRLAAQIAPILMGKHRPTYTPHVDTGDYVIVTNVEKVAFTGKKWEQVTYSRYSGHPGGYREEVAWKLLDRKPERILYEAVRRMMPKNRLGRVMIKKLKLYVGPRHPHQAQQPIPLDPKTGRPMPSGAIFAPEPSPPKPKAKPIPAETEAEAEEEPTATAPEPEPEPTETEATEAIATAAGAQTATETTETETPEPETQAQAPETTASAEPETEEPKSTPSEEQSPDAQTEVESETESDEDKKTE